jgi:hypothetical protein
VCAVTRVRTYGSAVRVASAGAVLRLRDKKCTDAVRPGAIQPSGSGAQAADRPRQGALAERAFRARVLEQPSPCGGARGQSYTSSLERQIPHPSIFIFLS